MAGSNGSTQHHAQRRAAAKLRLSFMFLDIFLGTFVVGIVLMTTLGRPISDAPLDGSGGLDFIEVEYEWDKGEIIIAPLVWHGKCALHPQGLATNFSPSTHNTVWPKYDSGSGKLQLRTDAHKGIWQDGFYADNEALTLKRGDTRVGHLLIAEPAPGPWSFAVRVVERPSALQGDTSSIKGRMIIHWSGFDTDADENPLTIEFSDQSNIEAVLKRQSVDAPILISGEQGSGLVTLTVGEDPQNDVCS